MEEIRTALSAGTGQSNTNVILRNVLKEDMFIIRRGFSGALLPSLLLQGTPLGSLLYSRTQSLLGRLLLLLSEWNGAGVRREMGGAVTAIVQGPRAEATTESARFVAKSQTSGVRSGCCVGLPGRAWLMGWVSFPAHCSIQVRRQGPSWKPRLYLAVWI